MSTHDNRESLRELEETIDYVLIDLLGREYGENIDSTEKKIWFAGRCMELDTASERGPEEYTDTVLENPEEFKDELERVAKEYLTEDGDKINPERHDPEYKKHLEEDQLGDFCREDYHSLDFLDPTEV